VLCKFLAGRYTGREFFIKERDVISVSKNGVSFFQFENLQKYPTIRHGIFTRLVGHSTGDFQSLNVSLDLGDAADHVKENRNLISQIMEDQDLVFIKQVHGDQVVLLNPKNIDSYGGGHRALGTGDALVTNVSGKFLTTQLADCQSILLYDPIRQVVANVHSGWRGSIKNILGRTLGLMKKYFKCYSGDIIAGIGPSLGPCCAEFVNYRKELPQKFWRYKLADDHFDFWTLSRDQLTHAGVLGENVEISRMCTKCNTQTFFSYRGEGRTGRFAAVIGLNRTDSA
jgi:YfiH family protein